MPTNCHKQQPADELILEGIVVTLDAAGNPNIAPMGPRVDRDVTRLILRPFATAQTYQNLQAAGGGVFHVTDDVELLAKAAVGKLVPLPALVPLPMFACPRLADACRWWAFEAESIDDSQPRVTINCRVASRGEIRPFLGFNRAKHAVLEAAILATRINLIPRTTLRSEFERLAIIIDKTAGHQEHRAFQFLQDYITSAPLTPGF